jgi:NAD+ dependent glucose-6-phosphate dehydrogenase
VTNTTKRKVLITGAGGKIGTSLSKQLKDRYDLRLHYRREPEEILGEDRVIAEFTNLDEVIPIMEGIDTVLHFAGNPHVPASWQSVLEANIIGMYNTLEAARIAGVRKVVFASTNHVMGMYDINGDWPVNNQMPQRPDSFYGVSKACGEDIGRYYYDQWGLQFIALRIGWFLEKPHPETGYGRAMWLSPRDCAQAFVRATEADVDYGVFYAISNNPDHPWDLTDAKVKLGYRPQDSWADFYPEESADDLAHGFQNLAEPE